MATSLRFAGPPYTRATHTTGELSNGLQYYVRPNGHPRERAELRIVIKVNVSRVNACVILNRFKAF